MQSSILLKYRLRGFANAFKGFGPKKIVSTLLILTLGVLFVMGDYWLFHWVISYLDGFPSRLGDELILQLVNLVFITLFEMVMFSSLIVSLSATPLLTPPYKVLQLFKIYILRRLKFWVAG